MMGRSAFYIEPCDIGAGCFRYRFRIMQRRPDGSACFYSRHKSREAAEARLTKVLRRMDHFEAIKDRLAQSISDVERVCRQGGVRCVPPTGGGSHYKVSHPSQPEILTIPARKPVKPIYIKLLVAFLARVGG